VVAAFFAFLIGLPVLRLKSDYLAIATLGFAEIVRGLVQLSQFGPLTNGPDPLNNFTAPKNVMPYAAIAGVCILLIVLLINSTYGRAFKAIRDDEIAAEAMGINLARHKMISFVVSSFFCGVAGAMLAMCNTSVSSVSFTTSMTYQILLVVVVGGIGSVSGSVIAAFIYYASSEWWLRFLDLETYTAAGTRIPLLGYGFRMVVFSVLIMIVVLFFRKGIMGTREVSVYDDIRKIGRFFTRKSAAKGGDAQ
jgi:branched-chain amino acid transport system permease protein